MSLGRVPGRTNLAEGQEGQRPGRQRQLPSRGSVNWLVREARTASPPAGRLACTHTHPHPTRRARERTPTLPHSHSPTLARTHCHKARLPPDSAILTRCLAAVASRQPQAPRPGGTVPPHPAAPTPLPAPAAAAAVGLASSCAVSPRNPCLAASRCRLRPPLRRSPQRGRPVRPPCWGPAPRGEAGEGSAAAFLAHQDPGSALQGDRGVTTLGASTAARALLLGLWRAGRGGRRRGAEGGQEKQRGRQPPSSSAFFLFLLNPRCTSQQLPHPQTPSPQAHSLTWCDTPRASTACALPPPFICRTSRPGCLSLSFIILPILPAPAA